MKKLIAAIMVLGALVSGTTIYANGTTDLPSERPGRTTRVTFENVNRGARLYVKDSEGQILYSEKVTSEGTFTRSFDLSEFPEGDYRFEVDREGFITIHPFSVEGANINMRNDEKHVIPKPSLSLKDDRVYLSRLASDNQSLEIDIYYDGHDLAYSEEISGEGTLERVYDFSTSERGSYLFSIQYEDRTLNEMVYVKGN